ncbi:MAG: prolipoprotein diacylglyceryl transferase [Pyrinomonadaceae bacterium]
MPGPFIHDIDPVIFSLGNVHFWFYGLSFTLGFINAHIFLRRNRERVGLSLSDVYDLTLFLAIGILLGGRAVVVFNNEWDFYRHHQELIFSPFVGGFASHGLILGGTIAVALFCYLYKTPVRPLLDVLAISAAIILGFGRIGNFIDGQIYGYLTDLQWGVEFPVIEGFRHPVVLYDGLKNFALVPLLLWLRSRGAPPGRIAAVFCVLYPLLRIPIDTLRDYPSDTLGLPNGQLLNLIMLAVGIVALAVNIYRNLDRSKPREEAKTPPPSGSLLWRRIALAAVCVFPLVIPSDATRDVSATYGHRHPIQPSILYPAIAEDLDAADKVRKSGEPK